MREYVHVNPTATMASMQDCSESVFAQLSATSVEVAGENKGHDDEDDSVVVRASARTPARSRSTRVIRCDHCLLFGWHSLDTSRIYKPDLLASFFPRFPPLFDHDEPVGLSHRAALNPEAYDACSRGLVTGLSRCACLLIESPLQAERSA